MDIFMWEREERAVKPMVVVLLGAVEASVDRERAEQLRVEHEWTLRLAYVHFRHPSLP